MSVDILASGAGVISFACFLLFQMIIFRRLPPERLLRSLFLVLGAIGTLPVLLIVLAHETKIVTFPWPVLIFAAVLSMLINGLLCLGYLLCIFGPFETSVRMRLVREIAGAGALGISHQELLDRYNPKIILDIRLRRLLGSGDIIEKDGRYRSGRAGNVFFNFDIIAGTIKKWIEQ